MARTLRIISQQRHERYAAAVAALIQSGHAYYDYARSEEIQAEREAAEQEKRSFTYSRKYMAESEPIELVSRPQGVGGGPAENAARRQTRDRRSDPRPVEVEWAREQDHVIQRADGSCLYHLATVVDDHDFQISHVIRAEEHLSNTPRQIFIAQSLGYALPRFAHVPFVAEPGSKTKLSKRKLDKYLKNREFKALNDLGRGIAERIGISTDADAFNPVIVDFYKQIGFLPDAINNYLVLLGWSLDDKTEFFTREEMIQHFSLDRVNKSPASFDAKN